MIKYTITATQEMVGHLYPDCAFKAWVVFLNHKKESADGTYI